jgi:hypothetical protein
VNGRRRTTLWLAAAGAAFCFWDVSCTAGPGDGENGASYPATEPKFVLANAALAFDRPEPQLLEAATGEGFVFRFAPEDVGRELANGYVIPATWARADFLSAAANLTGVVRYASLKYPWDGIGSPGVDDVEYGAELTLTFTVAADEARTYRADGTAAFEFRRENAAKWALTAWRDGTYEESASHPSVGRLLALFSQ